MQSNSLYLSKVKLKFLYAENEWKYSSIILLANCTAQKINFAIKDSFSKCDQIHSFLRVWSHLLKKSLMKNFIFCVVLE